MLIRQEYAYISYRLALRASAPSRASPAPAARGFSLSAPIRLPTRAAGKAGLVGGIGPGATAPSTAALHQAYERTRAAIGQGGEFDYQRKAAVGGKDGFVQLRQFKNVSNFNVGLYMQQAGFPLEATLGIAGWYAERNSSNYQPDEPYGLDPQTREFIEQGHAIGASGAFD